MPLILTSVPDLTGGVSQQPVSNRGMNQCENQVNAMPLVVGGLIKRPPLNHVTEITDDGAGSTQTAAGVDQILVWEDDPGAFRKMTLANLSDFAVQNGAGGISAFAYSLLVVPI